MPTLVQAPDVANTQVSQLQAVEKPIAPSMGLSDFVVGLLPQVTQEIAKAQDDGKDYNIALGMNDELNAVTRDVSLIDRKYYKIGHDMQTIQTAMANRDTLTPAKLRQRLETNPELVDDPTALLQEYEDSNRAVIDSIHEMKGLHPEGKKYLYEAQLQAHGQQIKQVREVIKDAVVSQEVQGRAVLFETFASSLLDPKSKPEDMDLAYQQYKSGTNAAYMKRVTIGDLTEEQAREKADEDVAKGLDGLVTMLANNTTLDTSTNLALLDKVNTVINQNLQGAKYTSESFGKLVDTQNKVNNLRTKLDTEREKVESYNFNNSTLPYDTGVVDMTADAYETQVGQVQSRVASGELSPEMGERQINDLTRLRNKTLAAQAAAENEPPSGEAIISGNIAKSHYVNIYGGTDDKYDASVMGYFMMKNADTMEGRVTAGIQAIEWTDLGGNGEGNNSLRRKASQLVIDNLSQFLTDPNSTKREDFGRAEANWKALATKAQYYVGSNQEPKVDDLLGDTSLTDAQRIQMRRVLMKGGSLKEAIQGFQNAEDVKADVESFTKDVSSWDAKTLGMKQWFSTGNRLVGYRGTWSGNLLTIDDGVNTTDREIIMGTQARNIQRVARNSASELSTSYGVLGGDAAVTELAKRGMIVPSQRGYNAATLNSSTAEVLSNVQGVPSGVASKYVGIAMDAHVKNYATKANVDTNNVFITSLDRNNKYVSIQHLRKDGSMSEPTYVNTSEVTRVAKAAYDGQVKAAEAKPYKVTKPLNGQPNMGGDAWGRGKPLPKQTFSYDSRAKLGTLRLTAVDDKYKGKTVNVQVPTKTAEMFNGNAELTMELLNHLGIKEGFHMSIQGRRDKNSKEMSYNGGLQISVSQNKSYRPLLQAVEGNPQGIMNVQADFMADYFKNLQSDARAVGIPIATQGVYPKQHKGTQLYLADLVYHGGPSTRAKVRNTLTQPSMRQGLSALKALPAYQSSQPTRQQFLESQLYNHYKNMGKL